MEATRRRCSWKEGMTDLSNAAAESRTVSQRNGGCRIWQHGVHWESGQVPDLIKIRQGMNVCWWSMYSLLRGSSEKGWPVMGGRQEGAAETKEIFFIRTWLWASRNDPDKREGCTEAGKNEEDRIKNYVFPTWEQKQLSTVMNYKPLKK